MSVHPPLVAPRTGARPWPALASVVLACLIAAAAAPFALQVPLRMLAVLPLVGAVTAVIAARPAAGAYLLLAATPLTTGLERGGAIPLLRPSEALLALVLGALALRGFFELLRGATVAVRLKTFDWWLLAFTMAGSVLPLLWMLARGREITQDDVLYAGYLWKYASVYLIIRATVRDVDQVRRCLAVTLGAGAVVAIIAVAHVLQVQWVHEALAGWFASDDVGEFTSDRATSTLGSSFAVADVMVFTLAAAAAWAFFEHRLIWLLLPLSALYVGGTVASGQFSAPIALAIATVTLGVMTRRLGRVLLLGVPFAVVAGFALAPVVIGRIQDFGSTAGVPSSWVGRWENLTTFFWPPLAEDLNWLTGFRVAGRVPAPESWRDWVWVESGYTWMLWSGGIVFLVVGCLFLAVGVHATAAVARERRDVVGAAAIAALTGLWVNIVLLLIDVHLTLRGAGDLLFALLALALSGVAASRAVAAGGEESGGTDAGGPASPAATAVARGPGQSA